MALCFVVFWGTFFLLISEAVTGEEASVGPPWFDRYIRRWRWCSCCCRASGRWSRGGARPRPTCGATSRCRWAWPSRAGSPAAAGVRGSLTALLMFAFAAFVLAVGQELWRGVGARRAMSRDSVPAALVALVRRNRRRCGYIVHAGIAVLFVGVAASSAFQSQRLVELRPGQTERVSGYAITASARRRGWSRQTTGGWSGSTSARGCGSAAATARSERSTRTSPLPRHGRRARADLALLRGRGHDRGRPARRAAARSGTAVAPDIGRLRPRIEQGDKVFADATGLSADARGDSSPRRCAG